MKSIFKTVIFLTMLLSLENMYANVVEPIVSVKKSGKAIIIFKIHNKVRSTAEISFQTKDGKEIFNEYIIYSSEYQRLYNIEELQNGKYYFKINFEEKTQTYLLIISDDGIEINSSKASSLIKNSIATYSQD